MIKLLILAALGRKAFSPRSMFNLIKTYLTVYLLVLPGFISAQTFEWAKSEPIDFTLNYELVNSQVTFSQQGAVCWASLSESLEIYGQFGFGNTRFNVYETDGNLQFTSMIMGEAYLQRFEYDAGGNLYLLLLTRSAVSFTDGTELPYNGDFINTYLVKLDPEHQVLWDNDITPVSSWASATSLTVDGENNVYVGCNEQLGSVIRKYNPDGEAVMSVDQENVPSISSLDVDMAGNILFAGSCANSGASFGGVNIEPPTVYNFFIGKYNAQMEIEWVKYVEDVTCQFPEVKCHDPEYIYFSGGLMIGANFGPIAVNGPDWVYDFFVSGLNINGDFEWVREIPESNDLIGDAFIGKSSFSDVDDQNNLYIGGFIRGSIDWGNGVVTSSGDISYDILTMRYDPAGAITAGKTAGGDSYQQAFSLAAGNNGNWYIAGTSIDPMMLDTVSVNTSNTYPFLAKIDAGNTTTGLQDMADHEEPLFSPNPATGMLTIHLPACMDEVTFSVIDASGQVLIRETVAGGQQMDVSELAAGLYLVRVEGLPEGAYLDKLILR